MTTQAATSYRSEEKLVTRPTSITAHGTAISRTSEIQRSKGVFVPDEVLSYEQLVAENAELRSENAELKRLVVVLTDRVAELERRLGLDSSNSSRPPSSDAPWAKPARKRSSRTRSGRRPGKQPGAPGVSRSLSDDPNKTLLIEPHHCDGCGGSLAAVGVHGRERRQVVDVPEPPPLEITEYQRISKLCGRCGTVSTPSWDDAAVPAVHAETVAVEGSPVRIGPEVCARAALMTCAHYLPVGRARDLLEALTAVDVSTGFLAGVRGRAARRLERKFLGHMRKLLVAAPVLHADETPGRAAGTLTYVHVACTEYLTLMHAGDRSAKTIDNGGVRA